MHARAPSAQVAEEKGEVFVFSLARRALRIAKDVPRILEICGDPEQE